MTKVIKLLEQELSIVRTNSGIDTNIEGFDPINQENIIIQDYLEKDPNNLCFKVGPQYYLINRSDLKTQLNNTEYHRFACKQAGDSSQYILDNNILSNVTYFIASALFGMRFLLKMDSLINIADDSHAFNSNLYSVIPTGQKIPAIISQSFIDGADGVGADHCQTGKEIEVYKINVSYALPDNSSTLVKRALPNSSTSVKRVRERVKRVGKSAEESVEESVQETINIMYKSNTYTLPITINTTVGELKTQLLSTLLEKGIISSINQNVKFLFGGKVYGNNDAQLINQIINPPFGKTFNAMVSPIQGGKKRKTVKKHKKKLTKKIKNNRKNKKTKKRKK